MVEEIIVTSQKRAQKLQKVPVAVSAFSAKDIARSGITNVESLGQHVAALHISEGGGGAVIPFLRGIGNPDSVVGNESSVALYLDDVYVSRLDASFLELSDISRIEVLKGPQGTLFGRNASAGVINIFTKDPTPVFQGNASVAYGSYNTTTEKLYLSGAIAPNVSANISALNTWQGSGWGRDYVNHTPIGYNDPTLIKGKLLFTPTSTTTIRIEADYSQSVGTIGSYTNNVPGTFSGSPFPPDIKFGAAPFYNSNSNGTFTNRKRGFGGAIKIGQDLGFGQLTSITGYRQNAEDNRDDGDYTSQDSLDYELSSHTRTLTQEVQLASKSGSAFDWIVGLFYLNEFSSYEPTKITGGGLLANVLGIPAPTPAGSFVGLFSHGRTKDYAGYTQVTVHLPYDTNLTGGFRYTIDDLDGAGSTFINVPGIIPGLSIPDAPNTTENKKATFKAGLDHHFGDNILTYASFSRGFKAGTYNLLPFAAPPTKPEVLDAYEVGAKTTLLDGKLQFNGALFYYNYSDPQVQEVQNHLIFLANAKAATVKGVDIEGQYVFTPDLTSHFGFEYLDAHYTDFPNAPLYTLNPDPPYGAIQGSGSANGRQLTSAPKFAFNLGFNYVLDARVGRFNFNGNYAYTGSFFFTPDNQIRQGSYGLLDASLSYQLPGNDRWALKVFGKNITGQHYFIGGQENSGTAGYVYAPGAPAEFGGELSYNFGN